MRDKWRLVHGTELYDLRTDPGQKTDVAAQHPDGVKQLRDHYEWWWKPVAPLVDDYVPVVIGSDKENPVALTSADWAGTYADNVTRDVRGGLSKNGPWHVKVEQVGGTKSGCGGGRPRPTRRWTPGCRRSRR